MFETVKEEPDAGIESRNENPSSQLETEVTMPTAEELQKKTDENAQKLAALRADLYGTSSENAKKIDAKIEDMAPGQLGKVDKMADWARRIDWEALKNGEITSEPIRMNVSTSRFSFVDAGKGFQDMFIYKSENGEFFAGRTEAEAKEGKIKMDNLYGPDGQRNFVAVMERGTESLKQNQPVQKPKKGLLSKIFGR